MITALLITWASGFVVVFLLARIIIGKEKGTWGRVDNIAAALIALPSWLTLFFVIFLTLFDTFKNKTK